MHILISGATQGLGEALVFEALKRYPNAKIVGFSRSVENLNALTQRLQNELPQDAVRASLIQGDISSKDSINAVVRSTIDLLGSIDVLVNNVGVFRFDRELVEVDAEDWELNEADFAKKYSLTEEFDKKKRYYAMARTNYIGSRNLLDAVVELSKRNHTALDVIDVGSVGVVADLLDKPMQGTAHYGHVKRRLVDHTAELVNRHDFMRLAVIHPGPFGKSAQLIADEFGDTWAVDVNDIAKHTFDLYDQLQDPQQIVQGIIASAEHFSWKGNYFGDLDSAAKPGLTSARSIKVTRENSKYLKKM